MNGPAEPFEPGQGHVVRNRQRRREPFFLSILADEAHALLPALMRMGRAGIGGEPHLAGPHRFEAEESAQEARPAGAEQAGDADDFSAMQRQRPGSRTEVVDVENRFAVGPRGVWIERFDRSADHQPHDLLSVQLRGGAAPDDAAVAKHNDAVGDFLHLFDEVGDVDDGGPGASVLRSVEEPSRI